LSRVGDSHLIEAVVCRRPGRIRAPRREIELPGKFGDPDADVPSTAARPAQARFRSSVLR